MQVADPSHYKYGAIYTKPEIFNMWGQYERSPKESPSKQHVQRTACVAITNISVSSNIARTQTIGLSPCILQRVFALIPEYLQHSSCGARATQVALVSLLPHGPMSPVGWRPEGLQSLKYKQYVDILLSSPCWLAWHPWHTGRH